MTCIKICGITREEDYRLAAELGAAFIGFVFHKPSPRYIEASKAAEIGREAGSGAPLRVGVFVDEEVGTINRMVRMARLDRVQLHGNEGPELFFAVCCPCWKAFRIGTPAHVDAMAAYRHWPILLADTHQPGMYGGSGVSMDEKLAERVMAEYPDAFLAGGIGIDNLKKIMALQPGGIDLSSSLETSPGIKSREKMVQFFNRFWALVRVGESRHDGIIMSDE